MLAVAVGLVLATIEREPSGASRAGLAPDQSPRTSSAITHQATPETGDRADSTSGPNLRPSPSRTAPAAPKSSQ
jgi:hypothetical protein